MKNLISKCFIVYASLVLAACGGGVDVGNNNRKGPKTPTQPQHRVNVPGSNLQFSMQQGWQGKTPSRTPSFSGAKPAVILHDDFQSRIEVVPASSELKTTEPTLEELQAYLKREFPDIDYRVINYNGVVGVRADLFEKDDSKHIRIYLLDDNSAPFRLEAHLSKEASGIEKGEKILQSARVKYQGVPLADEKPRSIRLESRYGKDPDTDKFAYSFYGHCYTYSYSHRSCNAVGFEFGRDNEARIGLSGYSSGRIIDLGPQNLAPFDEVKIQGEYLVSPKSKVAISDIYTVFSTKRPMRRHEDVRLKVGHTYLIRTLNWPDEEALVKVRLDKFKASEFAELTYELLVHVPHPQLSEQVDRMNEHTIKYEKPKDTGEVVLYGRYRWGDYTSGTFNFEYATRDNQYIAGNSWDLQYEDLWDPVRQPPTLDIPHHAGANGKIVELKSKSIHEVTVDDFPKPDDPSTNDPVTGHSQGSSVVAEKGKSYLILHNDSDQLVYAAIKVLELEPVEMRWARIEWRRVAFVKKKDP